MYAGAWSSQGQAHCSITTSKPPPSPLPPPSPYPPFNEKEILEAAHDRFRFPELKKKEGKAAADGKVEAAIVDQSVGKG